MHHLKIILDDFLNLIQNLDKCAIENIILCAKYLTILKNEKNIKESERKILIKDLISDISDSKNVAGNTKSFVNCIIKNNFDNQKFFYELWFGDFYDCTGSAAIERMLEDLTILNTDLKTNEKYIKLISLSNEEATLNENPEETIHENHILNTPEVSLETHTHNISKIQETDSEKHVLDTSEDNKSEESSDTEDNTKNISVNGRKPNVRFLDIF